MVSKRRIQRGSCSFRNWKKKIGRENCFVSNTRKKVDDNITLVLTYHSSLNQLYEILQRAHKHVLKSPRLHSGLPSPPRVSFRNPKTIRDKLVRSKLKEFNYKDAGTNICRHSNCDIWKIFETGDQLEVCLPRKDIVLIFHLIGTVVA